MTTDARYREAVATVARLEQKRVHLERIANAERERASELEQQNADLRRILATAVVEADDNPDYSLTSGELLQLLTGSGLDLTQDIADAEQLRDAEQMAGAR